jgi:hypothetical protein
MDTSTESSNQFATTPVPLYVQAKNTMPHPGLGLLGLPEEILLDIALSLPAKDLQSLALACQDLGPISREALIRTTSVAPINIWKLLNFLLSYPGLRSKMTQLQLHPLSHEAYYHLQMSEQKLAISTTPEQLTACTDIVQKSLSETAEPVQGLLLDHNTFTSDALSILLAMTPNVTRLAISDDLIDLLPVFGTVLQNNRQMKAIAAPMWHAPAVTLFHEQLVVLYIGEDTWPVNPPPPGYEESSFIWLRFDDMRRLKHLTVPVNRLGVKPEREPAINTEPPDQNASTRLIKLDHKRIFPASLEYLRISFGRNHLHNVLFKNLQPKMSLIDDLFDNTEHLHRLRCIELETVQTMESTIKHLAVWRDDIWRQTFDCLSKWSSSDIPFGIFFAEKSLPVDRGPIVYIQGNILPLLKSVIDGDLVACLSCDGPHAPPRCMY